MLLAAAWLPAQAQTFDDSTLVRRIQWPVRFVPRQPGGCDGLQPGQVQVWEDGVPVTPDTVQRTPLETIHVVLIDASGSMADRLDRARTAAGEYIASLPEEDQVMVASFSENLILHLPLTRDRERFRRALERVETGTFTAFNDALYYLVRYLRSRPERKLVIVLTDGCDTASLPVHPLTEVIELAEQTENLTVFPIGLDLPGSCGPFPVNTAASAGPAVLLDRLARRSGGQLFKTRESGAVSMIFRAIRRRMEQEGFITYRPIPFGEGPKDRSDRASYRKRRVKVRSTSPGICRVVSAGPQIRLERSDPREPVGRLATHDPLRPPFGERLPFENWWTDDGGTEQAYLYLAEDGIRGRAADILTERSKLYARVPYWERGLYRPLRDAVERLGSREFELNVPPFDLLQERLTSPEALLLHLLENDAQPWSLPIDPQTRRERARRELRPAWIHGQTLLELREVFALGLFSYPGYREFAERRLWEDYRKQMRRTLDRSFPLQELPDDQVRALRRAIDDLEPQPRPRHLQRYLAEWLGDVTAHDLVVDLETWAANRLLASGPSDDGIRRLMRTIDSRWRELRRWFPPPTEMRVVTPLVPAFDAERQRVGFYRILLPRVSWLGAPGDLVPDAPLAVAFLRRLLEHAEPTLAGRTRVDEIAYSYPSKSTRRRMIRGAKQRDLLHDGRKWKEVPMVHLKLEHREEPPAALDCTVLFDPAPLCVDLGGLDPEVATDWTRSLSKAILALVPECGTGR